MRLPASRRTEYGCDEAAARLAAKHEAPVNCGSDEFTVASRVTPGVTPTDVPALDSVELRLIHTSRATASVRHQIYNRGTKPVRFVRGLVETFDALGRRIDRGNFELRDGLQPGAGTTLETRIIAGASVEVCVEAIELDDGTGRRHVRQCPARTPRGTSTP